MKKTSIQRILMSERNIYSLLLVKTKRANRANRAVLQHKANSLRFFEFSVDVIMLFTC